MSCVLQKREFVRSIVGTINFQTILNELVTPDNEGLFPWLSSIAPNFERYHFDELVFEYRSTSSDNFAGTNSNIGTAIFYFNSDTQDILPTNKFETKNYENTVSVRLNDHVNFPIRGGSANQGGWLYTNNNQIRDKDITDFVLGRLVLSTDGAQSTGVVGELFVNYVCRFKTSKLAVSLGQSMKTYRANISNLYLSPTADWITPTALGGAVTIYRNDLGIVLTPNTITFPAGTIGAYYIIINVTGAAATAIKSALGVLTITNATGNQVFLEGNLPNNAMAGSFFIGSLTNIIMYSLKVTDPSIPATFSIGTSTAGRQITGVTDTSIYIFPTVWY